MAERALILVDIQKDFMPDGPLPTRGGYEVVPVVKELVPRFETVVATQDWHPPNHVSFASNHEGKEPFDRIEAPYGLTQVLWPDHCVQGSPGADFVSGLPMDRVQQVFRKGTDPDIDSYSGFFDNGHKKKTGLGDWLRDRGVSDVYVTGVATDVCVKFTALDARELGFETFVVEDATRGVEENPGDVARALEEMRQAGCRIVRAEDVA
ncbi:MAG: bifunctional nicotinamidase/pyrazinamidase [Myxococcota bacterium]